MSNIEQKKNRARGSNTLAENTALNGQRLLIDWVSASFISAFELHQIFYLLGIYDLSNLEIKEGARYEMAGYTMTYRIGLVELMHDPENNKYLLNLSGQGCRHFEIISDFNMVELLKILLKLFSTINRLDIAIDDFENIFTTNIIRQAVYEKRCVTSLEVWGNHQRGKIATGDDDLIMDSFYLGSGTSRYFLNIYDKKLEREFKNKEVDCETWTRTEIRLSYEYAQKMTQFIVKDSNKLGTYVKAFLNDKFVFLTPSALKKDKNKSRLAQDKKNHARWWRSFIGNVGKLKISLDVPEKTLDDTIDWHFHQVATSLAMIYNYNPHDFYEYIDNLTIKGIGKMKKRHIKMVENQLYLDEQKEKRYTT